MLGNARLYEALSHTQAALIDTNTPLLVFPNQLLSHLPLPSSCFRETSRPKVGSLVSALSTTKGTKQFDPADYLRFCTAQGRGGELCLKNNFLASVCEWFPGRVFLPCLLIISAPSLCLFSSIRASQCYPSSSLEDERDFLSNFC